MSAAMAIDVSLCTTLKIATCLSDAMEVDENVFLSSVVNSISNLNPYKKVKVKV